MNGESLRRGSSAVKVFPPDGRCSKINSDECPHCSQICSYSGLWSCRSFFVASPLEGWGWGWWWLGPFWQVNTTSADNLRQRVQTLEAGSWWCDFPSLRCEAVTWSLQWLALQWGSGGGGGLCMSHISSPIDALHQGRGQRQFLSLSAPRQLTDN